MSDISKELSGLADMDRYFVEDAAGDLDDPEGFCRGCCEEGTDATEDSDCSECVAYYEQMRLDADQETK